MTPDFDHEDRDARRLFASAGPDATLPPQRKNALRERFVAALRASNARPVHKSPRRKVLFFKVASATAAALAAGVLFWVLIGSEGRATAALPEVVANVRSARTATYDLAMAVAGGSETHSRVLMASPGKMRMESADDKTKIYDYSAHQNLILRARDMTASLFPLEVSRTDIDPLERVREMHQSAGRYVGRRDLDGRRTWVYEVIRDRETTTIWVDPASELPLRIQTRSQTESGKEFVVTLSNFAWNIPIDDSKFSLALPPGYRLKEDDRTAPDPDMLVALLKTSAGMGDGAFPQKLDRECLITLNIDDMKRRDPSLAPARADSFVQSKMDQTAKDAYWAFMRGLKAIERLRQGNEWRYLGAGVKLGDAGAVVCWWGRAGSPTRTAVLGNLTIKEIIANEIPATRP